MIAIASVTGCIKDQPQPLTEQAVIDALRVPGTAELRARIAALHHPLIRATDIDLEHGLTPESMGVVAVVLQPSLRAERDRIDIANAQLLQAGILPNPALSFSLDVPFGNNSSSEAIGYGLGIDWEITSLITRDTRRRAASLAARQIRLDVAWKEWQVAQAARQAAYDVLALRAQEADALRLDNQLGQIAQKSKRALDNHDLTVTDASAAQAASQEARASLASVRRELRDAELVFNQAVGVPSGQSLRLADGIMLPNALPWVDPDALLRNLEHRRIDLVALRRGYQSQEATVRAAILGQFPKISLGFSQTRDTGNFLTIGPSIAADLPFFDRNQGNIAIEQATRRQLFDEYVARVFEARADVARASMTIRSLNELIAAQDQQVQSLRALVDGHQRALDQGNLDVATYYSAAVSLSQKQVELTKLKQELIHAWIALELASGARLNASMPATRASTTRAMEPAR